MKQAPVQFPPFDLDAEFKAGALTEQRVLELLDLAHAYGLTYDIDQPIDAFWQPGDLAEYQQAVTWWPKDVSNSMLYGQPTLHHLWTYWHPNNTTHTFRQALHKQATRCADWLKSQKRNVEDPNETKEARRARLNREAQARWRNSQKAPPVEPQANLDYLRQAQTQVEAMQAQLKSIRAAAKSTTRQAYDAMMVAKHKGDERIAWAEEQVRLAEQYLAQAKA